MSFLRCEEGKKYIKFEEVKYVEIVNEEIEANGKTRKVEVMKIRVKGDVKPYIVPKTSNDFDYNLKMMGEK